MRGIVGRFGLALALAAAFPAATDAQIADMKSLPDFLRDQTLAEPIPADRDAALPVLRSKAAYGDRDAIARLKADYDPGLDARVAAADGAAMVGLATNYRAENRPAEAMALMKRALETHAPNAASTLDRFAFLPPDQAEPFFLDTLPGGMVADDPVCTAQSAYPTEGMQLLTQASLGGDPEAMILLANSYLDGRCAKDRDQAISWYRKAFGMGSVSARLALNLLDAMPPQPPPPPVPIAIGNPPDGIDVDVTSQDRDGGQGRRYKLFRLHALAGQRVRIATGGPGVAVHWAGQVDVPTDPYLVLRKAGSDLDLAADDDSGAGLYEADLTYRFGQTGDYDLLVGAWGFDSLDMSRNEDGEKHVRYSLTLVSSDSPLFKARVAFPPQQPVEPCEKGDQHCSTSGPIRRFKTIRPTALALNHSADGRLQFGDPRVEIFPGGEPVGGAPGPQAYADAYRFRGIKGQAVAITVTSDRFDPTLTLYRVGKSELSFNDDAGPDGQSRLETTLPETGDYEVVVAPSAYYPAGQGPYHISLAAETQEPARPGDILSRPPKASHIASIAYGQTVTGALADHAAWRGNSAVFDAYGFEAKAGDKITLSLTASVLPGLNLYDVNGIEMKIHEEPSSPGTQQYSAVLDRDGFWRVDVGAGKSLPYHLTLTRR